MNHTDIMNNFATAGLFRPVTEVPLHFPNGSLVPNKKAIMFSDTDTYINTVGTDYNLIPNEVVFDKFASSMLESGLNLDGMTMNAQTSHTQSRNLALVTLPEHSVETSTGDTTNLQLLARNSYDGSWKQEIEIGGFRVACTNGQVFGDKMTSFQNRHTSGFNIDQMAEYLAHSIDVFAEMGEQWMSMQGVAITREEALTSLLSYIGKRPRDHREREAILTNARATSVQKIVSMYNDYSDQMGNNAFALYNTMTDHASHVDADKVDVRMARNKKMNKIMSAYSN